MSRAVVPGPVVMLTRLGSTPVRAEGIDDLRQRGLELLEFLRGQHFLDLGADAVTQVSHPSPELLRAHVSDRSSSAAAPGRSPAHRLLRHRGAVDDRLIAVPASATSSTTTEVAGIEAAVGRCCAEFAAQHVADLPQQLRQIDIGPVAGIGRTAAVGCAIVVARTVDARLPAAGLVVVSTGRAVIGFGRAWGTGESARTFARLVSGIVGGVLEVALVIV